MAVGRFTSRDTMLVLHYLLGHYRLVGYYMSVGHYTLVGHFTLRDITLVGCCLLIVLG